MDFLLNEDQLAFADSAKAVFADFCSPDQQVAYEAGSAGMMTELWQQCVANGLNGIVLSEADGGLEMGMTELMAVVIEQGKALAQVPLWEQQIARACVARFGSAAAKAALQEDDIVTVGLENTINKIAAQAGLTAKNGELSGKCEAVVYADSAQFALLPVQVDGAARLVLLDLNGAGISRNTGRNQAQTGVAQIIASTAKLDSAMLLDAAALAWLEPRVMACQAALQLGVSVEHLAQTVVYVTERKQFERPIGSFQLVQGKMADCQMAVEALRSALYQLVYRLDANLGAQSQAYATRILAIECGHLVGHAAQHVHGGIGVDITYPVHRFGCWSRTLNSAHGGIEQNLAALGNWLAQNDKLGWKYNAEEEAA